MRRLGRQHLLFAVHQIGCVEARQFESVTVGDGVSGARFYAVSAKNTAVIVNVVNLGVALGAAYPVLGGIFGRLNINAVCWAVRRAQEARNALFQAILVALQYVHAAISFLEFRSPQRTGSVRIVLHRRGLEHLHEGDGHAFSDGGDVLEDRHTYLV